MPENINTRLGNTTLRHMSFLTRLENGAIRKLIATMKQAQKDIREIVLVQPFGNLVRGTDDLQALSAGQLRQLDNIQKEIDTVLAVTNRTLTGQLGRELEDFATVEGEMLVSLLNRNIPPSAGLQLQFNRLPIEDIERLVNTPLGGVRFADRINENIRLASGRIKAAMALGMTQNQTIKQISKQVQLVLGDTLINRAETLVRTEMARVANQVNLSAMRQNKEFIDKFIFVSSLDVTVCPICAGLHGEEFPVDHNFMIPVHPRCRCTWMPKLKNAKQLGIDTDSVPDSIKDLFDGKPPDMPLDFDTFLRGQSEKFQLENLGRARFDLFKQGVSVKAMATDTRVLTLAQLRKKVASGVASQPTATRVSGSFFDFEKSFSGTNRAVNSADDYAQLIKMYGEFDEKIKANKGIQSAVMFSKPKGSFARVATASRWREFGINRSNKAFGSFRIKDLPNVTSFNTGEEFLSALNKMTSSRLALTRLEEMSTQVAWHEMLHMRSAGLRLARDRGTAGNRLGNTLMEIVNEHQARHTYGDFLKQFGYKPKFQKEIIQSSVGYDSWVQNFTKGYELLGIDSKDMVRLLQPINEGLSGGRHTQALIKLFMDNSPKLKQAIATGASKTELRKRLKVYLEHMVRTSDGIELDDALNNIIADAKFVGTGGG